MEGSLNHPENYVNNFLLNPNERSMSELLEYSRSNQLSESEIITLAEGLANSGKKIELIGQDKIYDIPSTGGPSSLSTLLCPLFLVDMGKSVLKLGVPGRPAGGIDVLAQIRGYNVTPNSEEIYTWLKKCKYVHFLANKDFAPLDSQFFKFRKKNNGVNIPSLVIASLLSKKLAVGLTNIGLDIRVSDFGNFGKSFQEAIRNGERFNKILETAGIKSNCFLTNGNIPQQPYIGRGEALLALYNVFNEDVVPLLKTHVELCHRMAFAISEGHNASFFNNSIQKVFFNNIVTQGGSIDSFEEVVFNTKKGHVFSIEAKATGHLKINLEIIRDVISRNQNKGIGEFPDPCGLILNFTTNDYVKKGDQVCSIRCAEKNYPEFKKDVESSLEYSTTPYSIVLFEKIL